MAFLFQDQNQGTRNVGAHAKTSREAPQTVLFHPDFDRRLRICTESADPSSQRKLASGKKALAGLGVAALTAGGDFHPALRTSAGPEWTGLPGTIRRAFRRARGSDTPKQHVPMPGNRISGWIGTPKTGLTNSLTNCKRDDSDSGLF